MTEQEPRSSYIDITQLDPEKGEQLRQEIENQLEAQILSIKYPSKKRPHGDLRSQRETSDIRHSRSPSLGDLQEALETVSGGEEEYTLEVLLGPDDSLEGYRVERKRQ